LLCLLSLTFSSLFSFYLSAAPPDLHSFPTRRSSDLCALELGHADATARREGGEDGLVRRVLEEQGAGEGNAAFHRGLDLGYREGDRKSTRLNSSHLGISYAVFCLKKKKKTQLIPPRL